MSAEASITVRPAAPPDFPDVEDLLVGVYVGQGYSPAEIEP